MSVLAIIFGFAIPAGVAGIALGRSLRGDGAAPRGGLVPPSEPAPLSQFAESLIAGRFAALGELHRFAEMRGRVGFQMSDHLIARFAQEIEQSLPACVLGRVGRKSVEFVFASASEAEARELLEAISKRIESELDIDGCKIGLISHFGAVRLTEDDGHKADYILHLAETALISAQGQRQRALVCSAQAPVQASPEQSIAIRDLPRAITNGEFELSYQPKLHCRLDRVQTVEALLRWKHPVQGDISTQELIEIAEATGAIRDLTRWVIGQAVADQRRLDEAGLEVSIDVNLSGSLIANTELIDWSLELLTSTQRPMGIEVTETSVIIDPETAIANLTRLSQAGVRIAIDDYGSGLSSLVYLKQLPAHELKIDRHFIAGLTTSHRDPLIIRSTIDLAHALEMEVTAEGVDDPMVFALLRAMGCDIIQGYLIAEPMPLENLVNFLKSWSGSGQHQPERILLSR